MIFDSACQILNSDIKINTRDSSRPDSSTALDGEFVATNPDNSRAASMATADSNKPPANRAAPGVGPALDREVPIPIRE